MVPKVVAFGGVLDLKEEGPNEKSSGHWQCVCASLKGTVGPGLFSLPLPLSVPLLLPLLLHLLLLLHFLPSSSTMMC